jgi:hypothetical protein
MEARYDSEETTRAALESVGMLEEYDANKMYANPAKNSKFGMSFNWHNNLVPDNVVDFIAAHETVAAGIARAAHETLENTVNHRYFEDVCYTDEQKRNWFVGIIQELADRDGFGAFGEKWARANVNFSGRTLAARPADEDKGIDIRTTEATYQVKTGDSFKSNWERKEADHLIWVKTDNNEITGYEMR